MWRWIGQVVGSVVGILACTTLSHASVERGAPLVETYDVQELGGAQTTRAVDLLGDGRLVIGTVGGPFLFDGERWEEQHHPQLLGGFHGAPSLVDGRIYGAYAGDLGWFEEHEGSWRWVSCAETIPQPMRRLAQPVRVLRDESIGITWYLTAQAIYRRRDDGDLAAMVHDSGFTGLFRVGPEIWVQDRSGTLWRVEGEDALSLGTIPGQEPLAKLFVRSIVPHHDAWLLLLTDARLMHWTGGRFVPWDAAETTELRALGVQALVPLRHGGFAIASTQSGPLLIDDDGRRITRFGPADGVPPRPTLGAGEDTQGGLWLAQQASVVRIDLASGTTRFGIEQGIVSGASAAARVDGVLLVASGFGLLALTPGGDEGARFTAVLPRLRNARQLAPVPGGVLVGSAGVSLVRGGADGVWTEQELLALPATLALSASAHVPSRAWAGHAGGVYRIDLDGGATPRALTQVDWPVFSIAEDGPDALWLADRAGGLWRVDPEDQRAPERYGEAQGLPTGAVRLFEGRDGRPWFATTQGVRRLDATGNRLVHVPGLPTALDTGFVFALHEDADGNLWVRGDALNAVAWREDNGWRLDDGILRGLSARPTVNGFLREGPFVWVLRSGDLLRIDLAARTPLVSPPPPRIVGLRDPGSGEWIDADETLAPGVRDVRFEFAAPFLFRPDQTRHRTRLLGVDADFSSWTDTAIRDYTWLPPGDYQFEIESRDTYGQVSTLRAPVLRVPAPWFQHAWAKAGATGIGVLSLWLAAAWGARRRASSLLRRQAELQALVEARTAELAERNQQLAEQTEQLREVDRLKTRFFVNVGHEFRTPLTLVIGPVDDLLADSRLRLGEGVRETLALVQRNARRVLDLIVELLDVNRFEHGRFGIQRVPTDMAELLQAVFAEHLALTERHGHVLNITIKGDGPWIANLDALQYRRALGNLVENAAKYMARGGRIDLILSRDEGILRIAVHDLGRGIPTSVLPHVFDRFFQADGGDQSSGYGIGLALVREIVEAHDARIVVESTPGEGSVFTIEQPAASVGSAATESSNTELATLANPHDAPAEEATLGRNRPRVLVVDDHDDLRRRISELLSERFEVADAIDGPSAWVRAVDWLPDVVVADVMMPGFDGVELVRRLRGDADTAAVGVLLLTAKVGSEHAVAALAAGADDYLGKPFDTSELIARIEAILARAQRLRLRLAREQRPVEPVSVAPDHDVRWRARLDKLLMERLDDPAFQVEALANAMHVDRTQLFRRCKELLGMSPSDYLRERRLRRARELLLAQVGSVSEIAFAVGFENLSSFTRAFRHRFGVPPSRVAEAAA